MVRHDHTRGRWMAEQHAVCQMGSCKLFLALESCAAPLCCLTQSHLATYGAMAAPAAAATAGAASAAGTNAGGATAPAAAVAAPLDPALLAALPSLAPTHLVPPLQAHYLPTVPPPSVVDAYKQPPALISSVGAGVSAAAAAAGVGTTLQVRKRYHATDGVRTGLRKKKKLGPAGAAGEAHALHLTRELPDRLDVSSLTNSTLVQQLLALERRLDATIARKHADIQHALLPPKQVAQMVRSTTRSHARSQCSCASVARPLAVPDRHSDPVAFVALRAAIAVSRHRK